MATNTPLDNLSDSGEALKAEAPDAAELAELIRIGKAACLTDTRNTALALGGRFDLAYNAAREPGRWREPNAHTLLHLHALSLTKTTNAEFLQ